jgi:D-galactarolactone cycloisomerase
MDSVLVRIHTDAGITGLGESFLVHAPATALATTIRDALVPLLLGEDALATERLWTKMWGSISRIRTTKALSAVDQALWDVKARASGLPLYALLGGKIVDSVIPYATVARRSQDYVDDVRSAADAGFRAVKIAIGNDVREDAALVERVLQRLDGSVAFGVDANGRYDLDAALQLSRILEPMGLLWFEEPLPFHDVPGLAELRRRVNLPIAGFQEESTTWRLRDYLLADALSIYNVCLDLCGGPTVAHKVNAMVEAWNRRLAPHTFGPIVNFAATLHLAVASPNCEHIEYPLPNATVADPAAWYWAPYVANRDAFVPRDDGRIAPPDLPGTGIELDERVLDDLTVG